MAKRLRVIAVDPTTFGFGYILFEGPHRPVDWGLARARRDPLSECPERLAYVLDRYHPDALVIEDWRVKSCRRGARASRMLGVMHEVAKAYGLRVHPFAAQSVKRMLIALGADTKQQAAVLIANRYPELRYHLPRPRRLWESEDRRMNIFDAAALAILFFERERSRGRLPDRRAA